MPRGIQAWHCPPRGSASPPPSEWHSALCHATVGVGRGLPTWPRPWQQTEGRRVHVACSLSPVIQALYLG